MLRADFQATCSHVATRRRLGENVAALIVLQVINYAAPLITVPYLVHALGPAQFGLLSFAQAVALNFDLVTDYAFNLTATRSIAAAREMAGEVSRVFWSTLFAKCLLMLGSGIVLALLVAIVPSLRHTSALYAASFLLVIGTTVFPMWLLQGLGELKLAAISSSLGARTDNTGPPDLGTGARALCQGSDNTVERPDCRSSPRPAYSVETGAHTLASTVDH